VRQRFSGSLAEAVPRPRTSASSRAHTSHP
jgi:hypothetical protein